jgi:uncharacterized glyoxalase superfamily protein PhnB
MASDGCSAGKPAFEGFSLSLATPSEAEADRAFAALSDGGKVKMPLGKPSGHRASAWWKTALESAGWSA